MNQTDGEKVQLKISYRINTNNYEVPLSIAVKDFKEIIQKKEGVCAVDQKLMFRGKTLDDSKRLDEFSINHDDTLHLRLIEKKISVEFEFQGKNEKIDINNALNSYSMRQIKEIALKNFEIAIEDLNLSVFCDNKEIPDQTTLSQITLPSNGVLHLKKSENKQRVVITDKPHGINITLDVHPTETIWNLKVIIHKELEARKNDFKLPEGVKIEPRLFTLTSSHNNHEHSPKLLEDDKEIKDYKISQETTITLTIASMVVHVQGANRESYLIQCDPQYLIANVKKMTAKISKKYKEDDITLLSEERTLDDKNTIGFYEIKDDSILTLALEEKLKVRKGRADTKTLTNQDYETVKILDCETFKQVKTCLHNQLKLPKDQHIILKYEDKLIHDEEKISKYNFNENSEIHYSISFPLLLKMIKAKSIEVHVESDEYIWSVKDKIASKLGLTKEWIRLNNSEEELKDEKTVEDYGNQAETSLHVSYKELEVTIICAVPSDEKIPVKIKHTWKVQDLKAKIGELWKHPIEHQTLTYKGTPLEDGNLLYEYQIKDNESIKLLISEPEVEGSIKIFVRMLDGKRIENIVFRTDKIEKLRSQVSEKIKIPVEKFDLAFNTVLLTDDKTVEEFMQEFNLKDNTTVFFLHKNPQRIYIKSYDGQIITVEIEPTENLGDLKKKIETSLNIRSGQQTLVHAGRVLNDPKTKLSQNSIQSETTIFLYKSPNMIQITVNSSDGKERSVDVLKNDTILSIKKVLMEKYEIELEEQTLSKDGKKLEDGKSLKDYGLSDRSNVSLAIKTECDIILKSLKGNMTRVKVQLKDKVASLTAKIETEWKIPPGKQRLFFNGKVMDLNQTFFAYELDKDSIIYVVLTASANVMFWKNAENRIFVQQISLSDKLKILQEKMNENHGILVTELGPLSIAFDDKIRNVESITSGSMVVFFV